MDNPKEAPETTAEKAVTADQETLARDVQEDELQEILDEEVADTLQSAGAEAGHSGEEAPEAAIAPEIVQQTIDAEEMQETLDTRVLRDFDDGIITIDRVGVIRYINPAASMILGLTVNAVGKRYRDVFSKENQAMLEFLVKFVFLHFPWLFSEFLNECIVLYLCSFDRFNKAKLLQTLYILSV